jgi:hypothetical protein
MAGTGSQGLSQSQDGSYQPCICQKEQSQQEDDLIDDANESEASYEAEDDGEQAEEEYDE